MTISLSSSRFGNIQFPVGPARDAHATFSGKASQPSLKIQFGNELKKLFLPPRILLNPLTWLFTALAGTLLGALSAPHSKPNMEKPKQVMVSPAEEPCQ